MDNRVVKKSITWVTPDYFVDCDFNPDILKEILKEFNINWIILLPAQNARFAETDFEELKNFEGLKIEFMYSKHRQRNPKRLLFYYTLYKKIKSGKADVTYINCVPDPYFVPVFWLFNKKSTIFCAHDGGVHKGFDFKLITQLSFKLAYKYIKYVCMFSSSQAQLFQSNSPHAKIYIINLALKAFGKSNLSKSSETVKFLSFGVINYSKNIELLIQAACNIYDKGVRNFKVSINGYCDNWSYYESYIKYPEIFEVDTRIINNSEIADLFSTSHYFVQPYRHVSQSGAMKVAFYYNLPVLATNFPGFSDEIEHGTNGYLFPSGDVKALESLMVKILDNHSSGYTDLVENMVQHTNGKYSSSALGNKYLSMFNEVIDANK